MRRSKSKIDGASPEDLLININEYLNNADINATYIDSKISILDDKINDFFIYITPDNTNIRIVLTVVNRETGDYTNFNITSTKIEKINKAFLQSINLQLVSYIKVRFNYTPPELEKIKYIIRDIISYIYYLIESYIKVKEIKTSESGNSVLFILPNNLQYNIDVKICDNYKNICMSLERNTEFNTRISPIKRVPIESDLHNKIFEIFNEYRDMIEGNKL